MTETTAPALVIVLTTIDASVDPEPLARTLVGEHLAACVNILPPMQSVYWWQAAVESATERQLLIKTTADRVGSLTARLSALHPYEVPELLVVPVAEAAPAYRAWLTDAVR